jgi:hypothetical protein
MLSCQDGKAVAQNIVAPEGVVGMPELIIDSSTVWADDSGVLFSDAPLRISLNPTTANSTIRYTLDGSSPGPGSPLYDSDRGILIDTNCVLQAVATRPGWTESLIRRASFRLALLAQQVAIDSTDRRQADIWWDGVAHHIYDGPVKLRLRTATKDAEIRYTVDGSVPTRSSRLLVGGELLFDTTTFLKAVAYSAKWSEVRPSGVLEHRMRLQTLKPICSAMSRDPWAQRSTVGWDQPAAKWDSAVTFEFVARNPRDELRYTLDGTEPTRRSKLCDSGVVRIDSTSHIKLVAFSTEGRRIVPSPLYERVVEIQARPPELSQTRGWAPFRYAIQSRTSGSRIHFTRDGSIPDETDSVFEGIRPFGKYEDSGTVRAIAIPTDRRIRPSDVADLSFGPVAPWPRNVEYGTVTDSRDGRSYRTMVVRGKRWMVENMNLAISGSDSVIDTIASQAVGRRYSWSVAMQLPESETSLGGRDSLRQGVCPTGWHVPSDSEWLALGDAALSDAFRARHLSFLVMYAPGDGDGRPRFWTSKEHDAEEARIAALGLQGVSSTRWTGSEWSTTRAIVPVTLESKPKSRRLGFVRCVEN